jgi:hypothetical protein
MTIKSTSAHNLILPVGMQVVSSKNETNRS